MQDRVLDLLDRVDRAESKDDLTSVWREAKASEVLNVGALDGPTVQDAIMARAQAFEAEQKPEQPVQQELGDAS